MFINSQTSILIVFELFVCLFQTALTAAVHGGYQPVTELLLSHGSDVNLQDKVRFCFEFNRQNLVTCYQIAKLLCNYSFLLFV